MANVEVNLANLTVVYFDSHWMIVEATPEQDAANAAREYGRPVQGNIIGHYLSSEAAHEAVNTMKTMGRFGYPVLRNA